MLNILLAAMFCSSMAGANPLKAPAVYVVLATDTVVRTAPNSTGLPVSLTDDQPRADFTLLELVGQNKQWMHLQNTSESHGHMERAWHLKPYALQLYHRAQNGIPVLKTLARFVDEGGLEQLVLPGQPLLEHEDGTFRFAAGPLSSLGVVQPDQVSHSFQLTTIEDWIPNDEHWLCTRDNGLLKADETCTIDDTFSSASETTEQVFRVRNDERGTIALLRKNRWHFEERRVSPTSEHAEPKDEDRGMAYGLIGGALDNRPTVKIKKDSKVYWMNGKPAGHVRFDHQLYEAQLSQHGELQCSGLPWRTPGRSGIGRIKATPSNPENIKDYPAQLCFRTDIPKE